MDVNESAGDEFQTTLSGPVTLVAESPNRLAFDSTGTVIAGGFKSRPRAINTLDGSLITQSGSHPGLNKIDISADDKWLLTGTWKGKDVKIWNMQTGEQANAFLNDISNASPTAHPVDPDAYVVAGSGIRAGRIQQSQEPTPLEHSLFDESGVAVFSSDGKLMATKNSHYQLTLIDPESGRPLATFETLEQSRILGFDFSPDANVIVLSCHHNLQLLDISQVRDELEKLDLNW